MADFQKIKAVLFDLDGTLLDTIPDIGAGANAALRRFGLQERSLEEYVALVGNGIRVLIRQAVPEGTDEETYQNVLSYYLSYYPEHCTERTKFYPGIEEAVRKIADAGYVLGVISNKTERTAERVMAHFFPNTKFAILWGNNGERPLKPAREAGDLACRELNLKPEEILFVGDGDTDMEFASSMGFYALGVSWGNRSREQLMASGADQIIDTAEEMTELLGL